MGLKRALTAVWRRLRGKPVSPFDEPQWSNKLDRLFGAPVREPLTDYEDEMRRWRAKHPGLRTGRVSQNSDGTLTFYSCGLEPRHYVIGVDLYGPNGFIRSYSRARDARRRAQELNARET